MPLTRGHLALLALVAIAGVAAAGGANASQTHLASPVPTTKTPIKHLVVIFQENVSFDHYYGTYPTATNTDGQPFVAAPGTPSVDGLLPATGSSIPAPMQHSTNFIATNTNLARPSVSTPARPGWPGTRAGS